MVMTMFFPVELECDRCGKTARIDWGFDPGMQRAIDRRWWHEVDAELRKVAIDYGWHLSHNRCWCPDCVAKMGDEGKVVTTGSVDARDLVSDFANIAHSVISQKKG